MTTAVLPQNELRDKALEATSKLPPFSPVLNKLMASLATDDVSFAELAALIEKDTVLAGSVLRLVNSAFYARRGTVNSVKNAVAVLGIGKLRNLSMSMSLARMWNSPGLPSSWSSKAFNLHAVASAILADLLAVECNAAYAEGAFTAGLLQNVGLTLVAIALPAEYSRLATADRESDVLGFTHAELSGVTLERWHLPPPICEAVRWHHGPHPAEAAPLSRMVEISDRIAGQRGILAQPWMRAPEGEPAEALAGIGLDGRASSLLESFQAEYDAVKPFFS